MKRKILLPVLAAVILTTLLTASLMLFAGHIRQLREKQETFGALAAMEKEWILSNQLENGVITHIPMETPSGQQTITPYFTCFAVRGLVAGTVTREQALGAEKYLRWHLDHLNTDETDPINGDGTIYNHSLTWSEAGMELVSTGTYDSVDSYCAMFLIALDEYTRAVDDNLLRERETDVLRVLDAMLRCFDRYGLTAAKQEYPVQFLMDNCEVYGGLRAAEHCLKRLKADDSRLDTVKEAEKALLEGVEAHFWSVPKQRYEVALQDCVPLELNGNAHSFYPWGVAQLFPICYGLLDPEEPRAGILYAEFCRDFQWETLRHREDGSTQFFWCTLAYVGELMYDGNRIDSFSQRYYETLIRQGRRYPLYSGEAGWAALCYGHLEQLSLRDFAAMWR